jgi:hypothetical protein
MKTFKIVDPVVFVDVMNNDVCAPIEIDVTYDCGSTNRRHLSRDDYMLLVLETKFNDMGYDMKLIEWYGELKYADGYENGFDNG